MKKAQTQEIFVFILALVIFAAIVFFGYRALQDFLGRGEQVAFVSFKNNIEQGVRTIANEYGSVTVYDANNPMVVPSKYKKVCFIDYNQKPDPTEQGSVCEEGGVHFNPLGCDLWQTDWEKTQGWQQGDSNLFLDPPGLSPVTLYNIDLDGKGSLCVPVIGGRIEIRLEGRGDSTLLTIP